jgi:butyryl-CoA dehydrogenase
MTLDLAAIRPTIDFLLRDWLGAEQLAQRPRYAEHSRETFEAVLDLCKQIAAEKFEPVNRLVDVEEPVFKDGAVRLPQATEAACAAYSASGMLAAGQDYAIGGMQLPCIVEMAANSFFSAASIGLKAYSLLTAANANLLMVHGTERQKKVFAYPQWEGRYFGTMNLSEPQAGSSLSDIRTRATPDGDSYASDSLGPRYRLFGSKMWISGSDHEMGENIIHLVLAKIPDQNGALAPGTKSISLFVVPKWLVDEQGRQTGQRNDIALAGLNHKLGYRATTNALLNYGETTGAIGYLVGAPGAGLACMFHMMNEARIQVGLGAGMLGLAGYVTSSAYAKQRLQGRPVQAGAKPVKDSTRPPSPIVEHPDVKRMLLAQKAYVEGALALSLFCARLVDEQRTGDREAAVRAAAQLEVLTPIAKSWPSEWCLEGNSHAIQILGGYGYTRDFSVEQHWRDNRLNMIHEGAHGIQAQDLLGRKVALDGGGFDLVLGRMTQGAEAARQFEGLADMADQLLSAINNLRQATEDAKSGDNAQATLANATTYMRAFGHVALGWIWCELAVTACRAFERGEWDADFLNGKLAAARYFETYELPLVEAWLGPAARKDRLLLDVKPEWL